MNQTTTNDVLLELIKNLPAILAAVASILAGVGAWQATKAHKQSKKNAQSIEKNAPTMGQMISRPFFGGPMQVANDSQDIEDTKQP